MIELSSTYPQISDWSTGQNSISHNPSTPNINRQTKSSSNIIQHLDHVIDANSTNNDKQKYL